VSLGVIDIDVDIGTISSYLLTHHSGHAGAIVMILLIYIRQNKATKYWKFHLKMQLHILKENYKRHKIKPRS
jgi:hypothetical protein